MGTAGIRVREGNESAVRSRGRVERDARRIGTRYAAIAKYGAVDHFRRIRHVSGWWKDTFQEDIASRLRHTQGTNGYFQGNKFRRLQLEFVIDRISQQTVSVDVDEFVL